MYYFCTYFDHRYLANGIALYKSLVKHCSPFKLFVLCLNGECYATLADIGFPNIDLISLDEFEKDDFDLQEAKKNRSLVEYYFTCTPSLPLYILRNSPQIDLITYLDADLFFFSSPEPILDELKNYSIGIVPHHFSPKVKDREKFGIYNVSWMSFRRDENGLSCLNWYRKECNKWCYDRAEDGKFADQKYLDYFPEKFQGVCSVGYRGANVAVFNIENYKLMLNDDRIYIDDQPLIFFHFQGLKHLFGNLYDSGFSYYHLKLTRFIRKNIYEPYINQLRQTEKKISISKSFGLRKDRKIFFQNIEKIFPFSINALDTTKKAIRCLLTNTFILRDK